MEFCGYTIIGVTTGYGRIGRKKIDYKLQKVILKAYSSHILGDT